MLSLLLVLSTTTVGFIHSAEGKVTLDGRPVTVLTRVPDRATVALAGGSRAVYVSRGKGLRYRLTGPYRGIGTTDGLRDLSGHATVMPALAAIARAGNADLSSSAGIVVRANEPAAQFAAFYPFGLVPPKGLRIRWDGKFACDDFLVRVVEVDADDETWSQAVPVSAREAVCDQVLAFGHRYVVSVTARVAGRAIADAESRVEICDEATARAVGETKGKGEALAEFLEACGLLSAAADVYEKAGTPAALERAKAIRRAGIVSK